jgi:hypothetical protein
MRSEAEIRKHRDDLRAILAELDRARPLLDHDEVVRVAASWAVAVALSWVLGEDDGGAFDRDVELTSRAAAGLQSPAEGSPAVER